MNAGKNVSSSRLNTPIGKVWLSNDFPLSVEQFLDIVDIYSPTNQQLKRVQEFIQSNLPHGFPVKIQIPIFYLITASMEIGNFRKEVPSAELFDIPQDYSHIAEAYIGRDFTIFTSDTV